MVYRITNDLVDTDPSVIPTAAPTTRRSGDSKFRVPYARTLVYQRGFLPDSIRLWNDLPVDVTKAESLDTFKDRLSKVRIRC